VSIPFLQKTFEKYRFNPQVALYAVDVWECQKGEELRTLVKGFLKENGYTFPAIYGSDMAERYGVEGIPTKFVIDPKGKI
jgi:hypothetical protein